MIDLPNITPAAPLVPGDGRTQRAATNTTSPVRLPALAAPRPATPWHVIPSANFGAGAVTTTPGATESTVSRSAIEATASKPAETQLTLAAGGSYVRFGYGVTRIGAWITSPVVGGINLYPFWNYLVLPFIIGRAAGGGPILSAGDIYFDANPMPAGVQFQLYTGTQTQGVDEWLRRAYSSQGIIYADTLPGVAYGVLLIPPGTEYAFQEITLSVNWGTSNPVRALADFITNKQYGRGAKVNATDVEIAAAYCDEVMADGEPRRWFGLTMDTPQKIDAWQETLRAYAGVYTYDEGDVVRMHVDRPEAASFTFTDQTPANYIDKTFRPRTKGRDAIPTFFTIKYTDTSTVPWGVKEWSEPPTRPDDARESVVEMYGIQSHSFARREALRRYNEAATCDMLVSLVSTGEGIATQVGQVVNAYNARNGISAKPFRVLSAKPQKPGRWAIQLSEYQPNIYSDAIATGPQIPDTVFPLPFNPIPPLALTLTEDVYQLQTGLHASRILVSWTEPAFPFVRSYFVEVFGGGELEDSGTNDKGSTSFTTKPLVENIAHTVNVYTISTTGARSVAISATLTNNGKQAKPSDVPVFSGLEIGGEVRLMWESATDLDLSAHEVRYGPLSSTWESAALLDRIATPGVRYSTRVVPSGEWRFFIKGLDEVRTAQYPFGQESVNAAVLDLTVTSDAAAFLAGQHQFTTAGELLNMRELVDDHGEKYWVTDMGESWNSLFPSIMNSYTAPLASYHAPGLSRVSSTHHNFNALFTGQWGATVDFSPIGQPSTGSTGALMNLDTADTGYPMQTLVPGTRNATAQWGFNSIFTYDVGTILVRSLGEIHVTSVTRDEGRPLVFTSSQPLVVHLTGKYLGLTNLSIQAQGQAGIVSPATAFDRVAVNPNASDCLQFQLDNTGASGNHYCYWTFSTTGYVIASGDFLEYEYMIPDNGAYVDSVGGMDCDLTGSSPATLRELACVDANGDNCFNPLAATRGLARGVWTARKISLAPAIGRTAAAWNLNSEHDGPGAHIVALYRNVRITNGLGVVRQPLWSSGPAPANVLAYHALIVGGSEQLQQANSFDAYMFNSQTGAAIAGNAFYSASGV
jgi:hypothetical protein